MCVKAPMCLVQPATFMSESIKSQQQWSDLGIEEVILKNGVRLILRPTIDEDSVISLAAIGRGGTADLSLPQH